MKLLAFLIVFSSGLMSDLSEPIKVNVKIVGIKQFEGNIRIAIYDESNKFPNPEDILDYRIIPVEGSHATCTFEVKEKGKYAMAILHDINANDAMDFNFVGYPKEPYGFSKNPGIWFRVPRFDECAIEVNENMDIEIEI